MAAKGTGRDAPPSPVERYRVPRGGSGIRLADIDPDEKTCFPSRKAAEKQCAADVAAIDRLQDVLFAEGKRALLVVLQAMDAGGKDGTVRAIFGPVDPLGIRATNFRKPSEEDLAHDFLWRVHKAAPPKGTIGVFNRSHYEDVLVVRVRGLAPPEVIEERYAQINAFEKHLADTGTTIVKLFLHISKEEQRERLQERVDVPSKRWKFNPGDLAERGRWPEYMEAYDIAITRCSTEWAPWFVVPANRNWYRNAVVARILRQTLEGMNPLYPEPDFDPATITVT